MSNEKREYRLEQKAGEIAQVAIVESSAIGVPNDHIEPWVKDFAIGVAVATAKWADSHPAWVSVEDELPTIPEKWYCVEVLFRTKDSTNYLGKYFGDKWISYENHTYKTEDISHWMEIQPPRKEANNESNRFDGRGLVPCR